LPRKRAAAEVEHDVSERFHIISTGLLCRMLALKTNWLGDAYRRPSGC
jgi:hypothetical protein